MTKDRLAHSFVVLLRRCGVSVTPDVNIEALLDLTFAFFAAHASEDPFREQIGTLARLTHNRRVSAASKAALAARRKLGLRTGGDPPLGYRREGDLWVPDEQEQKCIEEVRRLKAERPELSLRKLARLLERKGYRNRKGRHFNPQTVARLLVADVPARSTKR